VNHQFLQELLADYSGGKLSPADAVEVRQALEADPELAQFSEFVVWLAPRLRQLGEHFPGVHPTGEELVAKALGPWDGLAVAGTNERTDWVVAHVAECTECHELVATIGQVERAATAPDPKVACTADSATSRRRWHRFGWQPLAGR